MHLELIEGLLIDITDLTVPSRTCIFDTSKDRRIYQMCLFVEPQKIGGAKWLVTIAARVMMPADDQSQ